MKTEIPDPKNTSYHERPKRPQSFIFRLIKVLCVLVVIILLLLYLIFKFGLGGGDGSLLSGGKGGATIGDSNVKEETTKTEITNPEIKVDEPKTNPSQDVKDDQNDDEVIPLRFEMIISFESDAANSGNVKEFACNIEKIDTSKKGIISTIKKSIICENMSDFEFAVEREIRDWRLAFDLVDVKLAESSVKLVPILNVRMNPFPGEGVFRKIESTARSIDPKISIMRSED
ncbi:MAG: hypothetical protein LBJ00_17385 [Planctomycetaceae bacterium]|jgi:hypothetical protein|nr:hypothetical protein [Planctomycetaceae bacterium]